MEALPAVPSAVRRVGRSNVWLVDSEERFVLRAHPAWNIGRSTLPEPFHSSGLVALAVAGLGTSASDTVMTRVEHSLEWVHELLLSLAGAEVIVPVPVPLLGGRTSRRFGNVLWETLSFVPGVVVGDHATRALGELGACLAQYHLASTAISVRPRPTRTPVDELSTVVDWSQAAATTRDHDAIPALRAMIEHLNEDLGSLGHADLPRCVLHGDPTAHNMTACDETHRRVGLIDFDLAYHDPPAADIAFAMWRTGRPAPGIARIDADRLTAFVAGYCAIRPLSDVERALIPVYLRARGLQMMVKRARLGIADYGPLEQVRWIEANQAALLGAVNAA